MCQIIHRPLPIITASVFLISAAFPPCRCLRQRHQILAEMVGTLDVALASSLAVFVLVVHALARGKVNKAEETSYRVYRRLTHGMFVALVVFFLFGDGIEISSAVKRSKSSRADP